MITSKEDKEQATDKITAQKIHPRKKAQSKEYQEQKAKAIQQYISTDKTTREIAEETGISRDVISKATRQEIKANKDYYNNTLEENRYIIARNNEIIISNLSKIKVNDLNDIQTMTEINLKQQKMINLIEGATISQDGALPSNINIQIINNNN